MKILITGKNSYIGNSFKNFLKDKSEYQVDEISVKDDKWKTYSFVGYDVIIHLAALVHKNESKYTLKDYENVNVELSLDIAKKAINEGVGKFIFFSTMSVFGNVKVINKETPLNPITKYGTTKLKAEKVLKSAIGQSSMSLTIIRPPMIYGLGAKGNPSIIEKISKFISIFPETFNRKSFISIHNLNNVIFNEVHNSKNCTIHPQDPNHLSTFQLFSYYRSIVNKKSFPLLFIGRIIKHLNFIGFINKVFGDLYYDFNE
jgi:UDP-glucose 4-epimerase